MGPRPSPGVISGMLGWLKVAVEPAAARRATIYAVVVGAVLIAINHGDAVLRGDVSAGRHHGVAAARGRTIALEAGDSYFEPPCRTGVPAGEVELRVKNSGRLLHNISFEGKAVDQDVAPGETVIVKVTMGKGPLPFSCKYHRGAGMMGALLPGDGRPTK